MLTRRAVYVNAYTGSPNHGVEVTERAERAEAVPAQVELFTAAGGGFSAAAG